MLGVLAGLPRHWSNFFKVHGFQHSFQFCLGLTLYPKDPKPWHMLMCGWYVIFRGQSWVRGLGFRGLRVQGLGFRPMQAMQAVVCAVAKRVDASHVTHYPSLSAPWRIDSGHPSGPGNASSISFSFARRHSLDAFLTALLVTCGTRRRLPWNLPVMPGVVGLASYY